MNVHLSNLQNYIQQQLNSGQSPDQINSTLLSAGWDEASIRTVFAAIQQQTMPTAYSDTPADQELIAANGKRKGRVRTGWQIFKQCLTILKTNRYLLRYMWMMGAWIIGTSIILIVIYFIVGAGFYKDSSYENLNGYGYVMAFFEYLISYFIINLYAAGMTANILDIFTGQRQDYRHYMHVAWSKAPAILIYSITESIVGLLLRCIAERLRLIGWILSLIFGAIWSLGTLFVIPIIVDSEKPNGISAIKQSFRLFKQTWGENILTKVAVNLPIALLQFALIPVYVAMLFLALNLNSLILIWGVFIIIFLVSAALSIFGSFANSVLNIALYYFATRKQVPPAFSAELLNNVFVQRKRRSLLGFGNK